MGTLYLVRHGQASFGADDYDQLSDLGHRQSVRLGEYFAQRGLQFDLALRGTLRRHRETFDGICRGAGWGAREAMEQAGLNEYDSEAVIAAVHAGKLEKPASPEEYRAHFRLLREGLTRWMNGQVQPLGMPPYAEWRAAIVSVLDAVLRSTEGRVLLVSSGGPISTAVGHILGTTAETTIDLNMRIRNSSVTEFAFTPKRHMLVSYNTLPHLEAQGLDDWVTYA